MNKRYPDFRKTNLSRWQYSRPKPPKAEALRGRLGDVLYTQIYAQGAELTVIQGLVIDLESYLWAPWADDGIKTAAPN